MNNTPQYGQPQVTSHYEAKTNEFSEFEQELQKLAPSIEGEPSVENMDGAVTQYQVILL